MHPIQPNINGNDKVFLIVDCGVWVDDDNDDDEEEEEEVSSDEGYSRSIIKKIIGTTEFESIIGTDSTSDDML
jgi:hypothetical protein